ncbi:MAG: hypothetical protein NPIRA04_08620 [Nitrospirales bacterium]|nr:MAG: hypothetical protein NPIRA04_08620 [Nitrospirales bacterium]
MANILVIHQDPLQLFLLTMLLESPDEEIISCGCLEEAIKVCDARADIDGVVIDLQTLKGHSWPFPQKRQWSSDQTMTTLAISSHYPEYEAERICEEYHVTGYLALPVKPQRLREVVHDLLKKNSVAAMVC